MARSSRFDIRAVLLLVALTGVSASCNIDKDGTPEFVDIASGGWRQDETLEFPMPGEDVAEEVEIAVRYTLQYPYHDLGLKIDTYGNDGEHDVDTLIINLRSANGKPVGRGRYGIFLKRDTLRFLAGKVPEIIEVSHIMSDSAIDGIKSIGVITKKKNK